MPVLIHLDEEELRVLQSYLLMDAEANVELFRKLNDYKLKQQQEKY
jgi:hypothetical protein